MGKPAEVFFEMAKVLYKQKEITQIKTQKQIDKEQRFIVKHNKQPVRKADLSSNEFIRCFSISAVFAIILTTFYCSRIDGLKTDEDMGCSVVFFTVGIPCVFWLYSLLSKPLKEKRWVNETAKELETLVKVHRKVLVAKRKIYLSSNEYGGLNYEKWYDEMDKFYKSVPLSIPNYSKEAFAKIIEEGLKQLDEENPLPQLNLDKVYSGVDYENFVEQLINNAGFKTKTTATTGDQGVDLIAYSDKNHDFKIAIQCKFYSKSVGNKAVQEVKAGMDFYECQLGCVCTNNDYTSSAKSLANKLDIALLNEDTILDYLKENLENQ